MDEKDGFSLNNYLFDCNYVTQEESEV